MPNKQKLNPLSYHSDFQGSIHTVASNFLTLSPALLYLVSSIAELSGVVQSQKIRTAGHYSLFIQQMLLVVGTVRDSKDSQPRW